MIIIVMIVEGSKMKLISAIRIIEEREKRKRKAEKEMQRRRLQFGNELVNMQNPNLAMLHGSFDHKNLVHVQSIFPQEDIIALKEKTGEPHIKEAISKAVYFYLQTANQH
ncbi:MAG: DUF5371 family protein [Candidatus Methanoperedens sp.]|nr:DUF5371 family protein [Candidatus Methanoperedens sp.]